ncbi:MAG TPA: protein-L-isoaspartate(D-aspartate) O-methyltransferase [Firmicutes bacterium]|jgi:protein-L-isoaspartate(D-aspartate) O-methyltransferase|nr:protein-L-isoaspartate(D-aspartate) O-methyltransferase [Bacillota bacterium]
MRLKLSGIRDKKVLAAMEKVPRHEFVPEEHLFAAYEDRPLPIGHGQTISQPYIVALMTELLELKKSDRVLEIGAGSGYQAAILAELAKNVYTVEIIEELAAKAEKTLRVLGYENVKFKTGDGFFGWQEESPFAAIIVTAAPEEVPPPLWEQLADGGRLVIPLGPPQGVQTLWKYTKQGEEFVAENHGLVRFVPFTRK